MAARPMAIPATTCTIATRSTGAGAAERSRAAANSRRSPTTSSGRANAARSTRTGNGKGGSAGGGGSTFESSVIARSSEVPNVAHLQSDDRSPLLRDQCMAGWRRMHAILGPRLRSRFRRPRIEYRLERHEPRSHGCGHSRRGDASLIEGGKPGRVHRASPEHERLEHDEADGRQGGPGFREQARILALVVGRSSRIPEASRVPIVVYARQDAEN